MSFIGPEGRRQLKLAARFASVGFELATAVVVGHFGGRFLDGKFGTGPWIQVMGLLLGVFAGFWSLFKLARASQAQAQGSTSDSEDPDHPTP
jgi:F0F1-type ATP synthase assembly protein I